MAGRRGGAVVGDACARRAVAAALGAALFASGALLGAVAPAAAQTLVDTGQVVSVIDGALLDPVSPDSSGITYRPDTGELMMCDSEVNESVEGVSHYEGVNV